MFNITTTWAAIVMQMYDVLTQFVLMHFIYFTSNVPLLLYDVLPLLHTTYLRICETLTIWVTYNFSYISMTVTCPNMVVHPMVSQKLNTHATIWVTYNFSYISMTVTCPNMVVHPMLSQKLNTHATILRSNVSI
jgi:hypothetical protein